MGERDSTKTRVTPLFDKLYDKDPTGVSWLARLLKLPSGGNVITNLQGCYFTIRKHGWGDDEVKLEPPVVLLSWLIRHPRPPTSGALSNDPQKAAIRRQWIEGSESLIAEGLRLLTHNPKGENWHIFEGPTQPDVYIETDDLVVVIEGKRTEPGPTTTTKWMKGRHQMLRHLDCAWEIRGNKKVVGFFIVEGQGKSGDVPPDWLTYAKELVSPDVIKKSLPHRGPEEQAQIAAAFVGVTTWQKVCQEFRDLGLEYLKLPDEVNK